MKIVKSLLALSILLSFNTAQATTNEIEVVAELSNTRPGNMTITPNGRMLLSQQPLDNPKLRVVELMANGSLQPFPTLDWADGPETGEVGIAAAIGVHTTQDGIVWILDMGSATSQPKLVAWDSVKNSLFKIIPIDKSALAANSFLQDFAIDEQRNKIYIADTTLGNLVGLTKPAFVIVDLDSGQSRRVLEANAKLMPPKHDVIIDGSLLGTKREDGTKEAIYLGLNPITIDSQNDWVYFGTVNGSDLFRIPTSILANDQATDKSLSARIELFGQKRPSDGIIIDDKGNVYTGDIKNSAVGVVNKAGYSVLAQDKTLLSWPDGFAIDNGWLYITQNQLHLTAPLNEGEAQGTKPYRIVRIKLPE